MKLIINVTMGLFKIILLIPGMVGSSATVSASEVSIHTNEVTGLRTWTVQDEGFRIELIQLNPDFVRAIYQKHNYPEKEVERIAAYCVFGTILNNTSTSTMSYRVADWRYRTKNGKLYPVKTKSQWLNEWRAAGIIFSWTLLPDEGEFAEGDWQQGFTTVKLPREAEFDLIFKWQLDGKPYQGELKNIQCSPDSITI